MRDYRKYKVWEKAHALTLFVYKELIPTFPKTEIYNLTSQIKRSCLSIGLNIVEGCGRNTDKDFAHFLDQALGSAHETEYCILVSFDLEFVMKDKFDLANSMINELKAKLINLIKSIRNSES